MQISLRRFENEIEKFKPYLDWKPCDAGKSGNGFIVRAGRKIQWTVAVQDEVAKLKASIGPQLAAIELFLQLETLERDQTRHNDQPRILDKVEVMRSELENLKAFTREKFFRRSTPMFV